MGTQDQECAQRLADGCAAQGQAGLTQHSASRDATRGQAGVRAVPRDL